MDETTTTPAFLKDMTRRGPNAPGFVIVDDAPRLSGRCSPPMNTVSPQHDSAEMTALPAPLCTRVLFLTVGALEETPPTPDRIVYESLRIP